MLQNDQLQHYWGTGQRMHMARDVRTHLRGSEKPHRRNNWDVKTYVRENAGTLNPNESEIKGILISPKIPFSGKLMEH